MENPRRTRDPRQTETVGEELAATLGPGDVVLVAGELGAGKTTFVRGGCRALGVTGPVTSPTFTIGQRYPAPVPVSHVDLYRVENLGEEDPDLLSDYVRPDTIAFVEWPSHGEGELEALGRVAARVVIEHAGDDERLIRIAGREAMVDGWILAMDTATRATAVALSGPGGELLELATIRPQARGPQHAAKLLPLCAEVLDQAARRFSEVDCLVVGTGPGTFTGLRIGVATARALARASERPLAGVSTLQSLALNGLTAPELPRAGAVLAVLDARRKEVFTAGWSRTGLEGGGEPLLGPAAMAPDALASELRRLGLPVLGIGEGAVAFREVLEGSGALVPDDDSQLHRVTAVNHCTIARDLEPTEPGRVQPEYLRLPDAELARRAAGKQ